MKNKAHETTWRSTRVLLASAFATVIMASGNAALAAGDGTIRISGNSTFSDCGVAGSDFALLMTGDLEGCLSIFVRVYTCKEVNGFAHYTERGREAFVGTLRGKKGRFTTNYTVDAAYATGFCQSLDFSLELSGILVSVVARPGGDGEPAIRWSGPVRPNKKRWSPLPLQSNDTSQDWACFIRCIPDGSDLSAPK